uniref:Eyes absent homolog n=1 Tax=Bursaphelenchus xylophilus TaxID=6326 RepID=A0A1I7RKB4_BURXY
MKADETRKRKKPLVPAEIQQNYKRVFIWELDELCNTHLIPPTVQTQLTHLIEQLLKGYFDLTSYEAQEYDHINIEDGPLEDIFNETGSLYNNSTDSFNSSEDKSSELSSSQVQSSTSSNAAAVDNLKKIAQKQQNMKRIYNQYRANISGLLGDDAKLMLSWFDSIEAMDTRRCYKKCLKLAIERSTPSTLYTNVVVGRETLPCSLARLLLNRAAELVAVENIYSAARNDRAVVLEKVIQKFKKEPIVIITANPETVQTAKAVSLYV